MGVRTPASLHLPKRVPTQNPPDFTLPNRDTPKTYPILGLNRRRRTFRGVCFCAPTRVRAKPARFHISAHGYAKNPAGFRRKPLSQDISGRMQYAPTRVRAKPARFHISAHGYTKNAPDFTFPNKDTPKSRPVLGANPCRRTFRGVCFCAPTRVRAKPAQFHISAHGYTKNAPGFSRKPLSQDISGRMQYAPTRIHEKTGGFHIFPSGYAKNAPGFTIPNKDAPKNAPDFTHSNKDAPKTCLFLGPNPWRKTFGGVCFCAPTRVCA